MSISSRRATRKHIQWSTSRTPRPLWRNRDYVLLWSGQALSDIGGAVSDLAFPLLVLAVSHSALQAGLVSAVGALPAILVGLPAGVLVDRWDRRRLMIVSDVIRGLVLAAIAVAYILGILAVWQLALVALVEGSLERVFDLAKTTAVPHLVDPSQLTTAIAQDEIVEGTTSLVGPALSGALFTLAAALPFFADAFSYGISLVTLGLIRTPLQDESQRAATRRHFWSETAEGILWVWRQPFILTMTLMMGAGALAMPGATLTVILLAERHGASAAIIGLIFTCFGVGVLVGSVLVARLKRRLTVGLSILVARWYFVLSWPLYALAPFPVVLAAIEWGSGVVEPIEDVAYFSRRLELIPEELRGRVIGACRLVPGVTRPIGLALTGLVLQRWGVLPTVWLQFGWLLLWTSIITVLPPVRRER